MNKRYNLAAVIGGDYITFKRSFASRQAAIDYVYRYFNNHYIYDNQVIDEIFNSKHDIEYVLHNGDRFMVNRVVLDK